MLLLLVLLWSSGSEAEPTTTKSYDIEVPGSTPIRIIEGEPLWKSKYDRRTFNGFTTDRTNTNLRKPLEDDGNKDALHRFLTNYADIVKKNKIVNENNQNEHRMESVQLISKREDYDNLFVTQKGDSNSESKNWDLLQFQKHKHPHDDRKGWVSMEPVPWSVSKISKWQSSYKPSTLRPWEDYDSDKETVYGGTPQTSQDNYNKPSNNYDVYYLNSNTNSNKPIFTKPTAIFGHKVQVDYHSPNKYHKHDENCNHHQDSEQIITDGLPPNFPQQYEANRRRGTEMHPETHPFSGEGDWVLLSTTKGYRMPHKQRSLQINPESIGAHRGVRLTVLPPLKNSKVNMTTSHGGLLQVESTFQTVEQAQKQYLKKSKQKLKKKPQRNQQNITNKPVRQLVAPALTTKRHAGPDSSAVLAAVGAGMIPATMAMLVPMALGKRKKRSLLQIPLPLRLQ